MAWIRSLLAANETRPAPVGVAVAVGLLVIVEAVLLALVFRGHGYDDPYITYRYAHNIANGLGFVYNPGDQTLSTTTPLYAILLAGMSLSGVSMPLLSNLLGCVGLAVSGVTFWRLGVLWNSPVVGLVGALLYPPFPLLITTLGSEMILTITLVLVGFLACAEQRYYLAAVLFAIATLTRADSLIAVGVAGVFVLHQHQFRWAQLPWRSGLLFILLLLPWCLFAWFYFGSPLPVTLAAKQRQGLMLISQSFIAGLSDQFWLYWSEPFYRLHIALAGGGLIWLVLRLHYWLLLVGWSMLYAIAYSLLGVTSYFWYYAPLVVGFITLVGLGVETLVKMLGYILRHQYTAQLVRRWQIAATALTVVLLLIPQIISLAAIAHHGDPRLPVYRAAGEWLRQTTPPQTRVATLEVGIIGYYAQRPMIDFAGLLQPQIAHQITIQSTYEDTAGWALYHFQPDYILLQTGLFPGFTQDSMFRQSCQPIEEFVFADARPPLIIYHCTHTEIP